MIVIEIVVALVFIFVVFAAWEGLFGSELQRVLKKFGWVVGMTLFGFLVVVGYMSIGFQLKELGDKEGYDKIIVIVGMLALIFIAGAFGSKRIVHGKIAIALNWLYICVGIPAIYSLAFLYKPAGSMQLFILLFGALMLALFGYSWSLARRREKVNQKWVERNKSVMDALCSGGNIDMYSLREELIKIAEEGGRDRKEAEVFVDKQSVWDFSSLTEESDSTKSRET